MDSRSSADAGQALAQNPREIFEHSRVVEEKDVKGSLSQRNQLGLPFDNDGCRALASLKERHLTEKVAALQRARHALLSVSGPDLELAAHDDREGVSRVSRPAEHFTLLMSRLDEEALQLGQFVNSQESEHRDSP